MYKRQTLQPGEITKIPLGFGIEVPDGFAGYVFPRSSMAVKGLVSKTAWPLSASVICANSAGVRSIKPLIGSSLTRFWFCLLYTSRCV